MPSAEKVPDSSHGDHKTRAPIKNRIVRAGNHHRRRKIDDEMESDAFTTTTSQTSEDVLSKVKHEIDKIKAHQLDVSEEKKRLTSTTASLQAAIDTSTKKLEIHSAAVGSLIALNSETQNYHVRYRTTVTQYESIHGSARGQMNNLQAKCLLIGLIIEHVRGVTNNFAASKAALSAIAQHVNYRCMTAVNITQRGAQILSLAQQRYKSLVLENARLLAGLRTADYQLAAYSIQIAASEQDFESAVANNAKYSAIIHIMQSQLHAATTSELSAQRDAEAAERESISIRATLEHDVCELKASQELANRDELTAISECNAAQLSCSTHLIAATSALEQIRVDECNRDLSYIKLTDAMSTLNIATSELALLDQHCAEVTASQVDARKLHSEAQSLKAQITVLNSCTLNCRLQLETLSREIRALTLCKTSIMLLTRAQLETASAVKMLLFNSRADLSTALSGLRCTLDFVKCASLSEYDLSPALLIAAVEATGFSYITNNMLENFVESGADDTIVDLLSGLSNTATHTISCAGRDLCSLVDKALIIATASSEQSLTHLGQCIADLRSVQGQLINSEAKYDAARNISSIAVDAALKADVEHTRIVSEAEASIQRGTEKLENGLREKIRSAKAFATERLLVYQATQRPEKKHDKYYDSDECAESRCTTTWGNALHNNDAVVTHSGMDSCNPHILGMKRQPRARECTLSDDDDEHIGVNSDGTSTSGLGTSLQPFVRNQGVHKLCTMEAVPSKSTFSTVTDAPISISTLVGDEQSSKASVNIKRVRFIGPCDVSLATSAITGTDGSKCNRKPSIPDARALYTTNELGTSEISGRSSKLPYMSHIDDSCAPVPVQSASCMRKFTSSMNLWPHRDALRPIADLDQGRLHSSRALHHSKTRAPGIGALASNVVAVEPEHIPTMHRPKVVSKAEVSNFAENVDLAWRSHAVNTHFPSKNKHVHAARERRISLPLPAYIAHIPDTQNAPATSLLPVDGKMPVTQHRALAADKIQRSQLKDTSSVASIDTFDLGMFSDRY